MSLFSFLLAIIFAVQLVALILFVIFGEVTVRRLRKNPATKDALGMEFISGWDILNVASALALPRRFTRKLKKSPLAALRADSDLLYKYTTRLDRILAKILYYLLISTVATMLLLIFLDEIGFFK